MGFDLADLEFVREGLILTLRRSKTDQEGRGRRIGIPHARGRWRPVREAEAWIEVAEITEGPLFRSLRNGNARGARRGMMPSRSVSTRSLGQVGLLPAVQRPTKFGM